jgi:hypothetical protein
MSDDVAARLRKGAVEPCDGCCYSELMIEAADQLTAALESNRALVEIQTELRERISAAVEREAEHQKTFERHAEIIGAKGRHMDNLVRRLRDERNELATEAADEIERLIARSVAMGKVVEAAVQFKVLVEHQYFQAEKIGEVRQKLFDTINEYNALLLPLGRGMK